MQTLDVEEARARLPELIDALAEEREVIITRDGERVARISPLPMPAVDRSKPIRSMLDTEPCALGDRLRPYPHPDDDLLGEMLEDKFEHWPYTA